MTTNMASNFFLFLLFVIAFIQQFLFVCFFNFIPDLSLLFQMARNGGDFFN